MFIVGQFGWTVSCWGSLHVTVSGSFLLSYSYSPEMTLNLFFFFSGRTGLAISILKFLLGKKRSGEDFSTSLTIKLPVKTGPPIPELSGALPCVYLVFLLAFFTAGLGFSVFKSPKSLLLIPLSFNLNLFFNRSYLFCSLPLRFYIILLSF